jgi:FtsH-binding integral membrane protein
MGTTIMLSAVELARPNMMTIGLVLSAGVAVFAGVVGFDRDRAFYPAVMIVIASYYVLFAVMSGSLQTVVIESAVMTLFAAAAVAGFKSSAWIVVVALAGHGVFDAVHGYVIENAGVPAWCLAYDVGAAAALAWLLRRGLVATDVRG